MFDFNKIDDFDKHISLSIPSYENLLDIVLSVSNYFLDPKCNVYDLGCSTGSLLKRMVKIYDVNYIGIDESSLLPNHDVDGVNFIRDDIFNVDMKDASLITSIFTNQFTDRSKRDDLYKRINDALLPNGAFIIAEKTYCGDGKIQDIINSSYYEYKRKNFSAKEILEKELSLRQNLKTERYDVLKNRLSEIGETQEIWRCFNFVAFLVIKR